MVLPFCFFMEIAIYAIDINLLQVFVLARYSKKETEHNFRDIILPYHNLE